MRLFRNDYINIDLDLFLAKGLSRRIDFLTLVNPLDKVFCFRLNKTNYYGRAVFYIEKGNGLKLTRDEWENLYLNKKLLLFSIKDYKPPRKEICFPCFKSNEVIVQRISGDGAVFTDEETMEYNFTYGFAFVGTTENLSQKTNDEKALILNEILARDYIRDLIISKLGKENIVHEFYDSLQIPFAEEKVAVNQP